MKEKNVSHPTFSFRYQEQWTAKKIDRVCCEITKPSFSLVPPSITHSLTHSNVTLAFPIHHLQSIPQVFLLFSILYHFYFSLINSHHASSILCISFTFIIISTINSLYSLPVTPYCSYLIIFVLP